MTIEKSDPKKSRSHIRRIGGYLHRVIPVFDSAGTVMHYAIQPLMVEFRLKDLMQVIVGASVLAVPLAFTQEVWDLGNDLPFLNVACLSVLSLIFIAGFVYYNFYRGMLKKHVFECVKRICGIYVLSLIVVSAILTIILKCPWTTDYVLALKRVLIVAFPASMSAAVSDGIK